MENTVSFKGRIDGLFWFTLSIGVVIYLFSYSGLKSLYFIIPYLIVVSFIFSSIRYTINQDYLTIHSFLGRYSIPIQEIKEIKRSYNPLSAPATSLKRLEVKYGKNQFALISPANEEEFLRRLRSINPNITITI